MMEFTGDVKGSTGFGFKDKSAQRGILTMSTLAHYQQLATVFDYPDADLPTQLRELCELLQSHLFRRPRPDWTSFAKALPCSGDRLSGVELDEVQEIFTRSFDVQAITTLSVGYIVFGDDYKRAELLVNLNREHRDAGLDCGKRALRPPSQRPAPAREVARPRPRGGVRRGNPASSRSAT